jgi:hypothetical protein
MTLVAVGQEGQERSLDADPVVDGLWQGGALDPDRSYRPFTMIVLCARELQPTLPRFAGRVVRPAFDDTLYPTAREIAAAVRGAAQVVDEFARGGQVLVTCAAGRNRSGLVMGLALVRLKGAPGPRIIELIRDARGPEALSNRRFAQLIVTASKDPKWRHERHRR